MRFFSVIHLGDQRYSVEYARLLSVRKKRDCFKYSDFHSDFYWLDSGMFVGFALNRILGWMYWKKINEIKIL